ncbi:hypothetical protein DCAR_0518721 [Daucus carota subsp. sativus]|uniref:Uncharacterized protein n=1 Tax=Daucus carota subsp. sativus TaxID=79200 RepID=A0A161YIQ7_DAUCS|nr:hypothetical protein DCAR_0518721 [Daucus carota subsp. sativus]
MQSPRKRGKRESSMIDDAEESGGNKLKGGVSREQLKVTVEAKKRRKIVMLENEDDNENGDAY